MLRLHPHPHPLIYLKGVKYQHLLAVLDFMYHGEVNVTQEELNSILAVAEELKVKGLSEERDVDPPDEQDATPPQMEVKSEPEVRKF